MIDFKMLNVNLLFVENNQSKRNELGKLLKTKGFVISFVSSVAEGLKILTNRKVDLVVSELSEPEINGIQLLEKARSQNLNMPFIFVTTDCEVSKAVQAIKMGASDILLKPVAPNTLLESIETTLKQYKDQKNLRHSEIQLKMLLENVPDLVYSLDPEGIFISLNGSTKSLLGYTVEEMLGQPVFKYIYSEDKKILQDGFINSMQTGSSKIKTIQFRMVSKTGEIKHFEVNRKLIFENGEIVRQDGIARDITARQRMEIELQSYSRKLEQTVKERTTKLELATEQLTALNKTSNRFTQIFDEDELLDEIPHMLTHTLDFDRATFLMADKGALNLRSHCLEKDTPEMAEAFIKRIESPDFELPPPFTESFKKGETVFISDLNKDPRWPKEEGQIIRTKAIVVAPIKANKKPIGVIIGNMQHHEREMDLQDVERFEMFSNMVGLTLDNIRAYKSLEKKVLEKTKSLKNANRELRTQTKQLEKQAYSIGKANVALLEIQEELEQKNRILEQTDKQMRSIVEVSPIPFLVSKKDDGTILYANDQLAELIGVQRTELIGKQTPDFYKNPSDRKKVLEEFKSKGYVKSFEVEIKKADGSTVWNIVSIASTELSGEQVLIASLYDIDERRKMEEALRETEEKFRQLTENIEEVFWIVDLNLNQMLFISPSYEEIFGRPAANLFKNPDDWMKAVHPDDLRKLSGDTGNTANNENEQEFRIIQPDKSIHWIRSRAFPIFNKQGEIYRYCGVSENITERKLAEEKLQLYKQIFINSNDPINIMAPNGFFIEQNPAAEKLSGYTKEELLSKTPELFAGENAFNNIRKALREKGKFRGEIISTHKNGGKSDVELSAFSIWDEYGEVAYQVGFARNITKRKEAEKILQQSLEELETTNKHLNETQSQLVQSEKMASLGMLVAGIAHEINTPIGAVSSMHDTLKRAVVKLKEALEKDYPKFSNNPGLTKPLKIIQNANQIIDNGSERVINIVKRLRSFARLDEAELKTVDLHEGIEDTLTLIYHEIKHNITVKKDFAQIQPIACYPGKLNQVYLNLLINAKQAIQDKGEIQIKTYKKDKNIFVQISDNGVGIPQEKLSKIFDPGFTTKGVGVGTGLGLSICYQIIEEHHGQIRAESQPGVGTTFTITFPTNLDEILENT